MAKKIVKVLLYPVIVETCEEGGYFAYCPSIQGCHAEGGSYSEVIENIEDVIKAHLEVRKKYREFLPGVEVKKGTQITLNLPILIYE